MNKLLHNLQTEGVTMMPYAPELRQKVIVASELWQAFCELPFSEKQRFVANDQGAGTGYELKTGDGNHADRKENFDVAPAHREYLESLLTQSTPGCVAAQFAEAALQLADAMYPLAAEFATAAEAEYHIDDFTKIMAASRENIFIRFLHYFGDRQAGDSIAEPHTDQSGFTFHLYETDRGCQRLDYDTRTWTDMPVAAGHTAVIPAMQLQLVSNGELRALAHRVVATEQTYQIGRSAIVCFVRLADTPVYDKATQGRLQEREPGFNYDMPPETFRTLFTDS